jgi:NADPH:quinone reductase-like Zn-dependent oxidoreductase
MKAIVYRRHGEPSEVLAYEDVAAPADPGPNEVAVRVSKRMLHPFDSLLIRGIVPVPIPDRGAVPGGDGVGVVEQVGAGVNPSTGIVPGKRVILFPVLGTWTERVVAPALTIMPIPDDVSDATACQIIINGIAAIALMRAALIAQGQAGLAAPLLITAAGSGVSRNLIALAQMRGAKVVAVVRSDEGAAILTQSMPGVAVVSTERKDWAEAMATACGQAPSVVIDPIGGGTTAGWLDLLADRASLRSRGSTLTAGRRPHHPNNARPTWRTCSK